MPLVTRYSVMPIPAVAERERSFAAGGLRIGVEYRLLTDAIAAAAELEDASGDTRGQTTELDDRGVALHVYAEQDGEEREFLRFDCFQEDPHYHYVSWREKRNDMVHIDPVTAGDPLEWALDRLGDRLAEMLRRAGAPDVAERMDAAAVADLLPEVRAAAERARRAHDRDGGRGA